MPHYSISSAQLTLESPGHRFGGTWTSEKLHQLKLYLSAYTRVFKNQRYLRTVYIDAFAGSGLIELKTRGRGSASLFPELADEGMDRFIDGSARVALGIEPAFSTYVFVDKNRTRASKLELLKQQFPEQASRIRVQNDDANAFLARLKNKSWKQHRAVLFLDPYGMQVRWSSLEAVAATRAIDLWYLFPLGVGVNRLLATNGQIGESLQLKLDEIFGTPRWRIRK